MKIRWVLFYCLFVLFFSACSSGASSQPSDNLSTPTPIPPSSAALEKTTYEVKKGEIKNKKEFNGRIVPVNQSTSYFQSGGIVRNVYFKSGDQVKVGDVIADLVGIDKIESQKTNSDLELRRAEVQLKIALLQLAQTKVRASSQMEKNFDVKMQEFQAELAQINLDQVKLQIKDMNQSVDGMRLISPIDGQIMELDVLPGKDVSALDPLALVADMSELEVGADLTSNDTAKLTVGMKSSIELVLSPGKQFDGTIHYIPTSLNTLSSSLADDRLVRISLDTLPEGEVLKPGDAVHISTVLESKPDALWLPPQAIRTFEGRTFVVVKDGDLQKRIDVKTGLLGQDQIEILEGLTEGQIVVGK